MFISENAYQITNITITNSNDEFYPTPDELAGKMLTGVDWLKIETVLEPSAGKGNLVSAAMKACCKNSRYNKNKLQIDCIEIDPYLRSIIKYEFGGERLREIIKESAKLEHHAYNTLNQQQKNELSRFRELIKEYKSLELHIIHDDFLTYQSVKQHDLILMNPPFSEGDKHLIKALELQKNGGEIICLLNAETLRNTYTNSRKLLVKLLNQYKAKIQYINNAFTHAERKTDVEVAIVCVSIPIAERPKSTIYERMKKAASMNKEPDNEASELTVNNIVQNLIIHCNVETAASLELVREYRGLKPYILDSHDETNVYRKSILTLCINGENGYEQDVNINKYLRLVRLKYWNALFSNKKFMGRLTSNLQTKYREMVDKMADYDFTMFNIQTVLSEMNSEMIQGVKDTILDLFDKLSVSHSWYPECNGNVHYWNGWKTNKAHKVNYKVIIPTYGMFSSYSWSKSTFEVSNAFSVLSDIEKTFNYLDGGLTVEIDLYEILENANNQGVTRNISCKYFDVTLYKKGTTHIKFKNTALVDKLNIYAARNRMWLPPDYGKKQYSEMNAESRQVVDEFQGKVEYEKVMANQSYYLFEVVSNIQGLIACQESNENDS